MHPQPRGGFNGRRGGSFRGHTNYGHQNFRGRGPLPHLPPPPPPPPHLYRSTPRSAEVERWVQTASTSRSSDPCTERTGGRDLMDRIEGIDYDGPIAPRSPLPAPSQLELPRRTPSSFRGYTEPRRDESRTGKCTLIHCTATTSLTDIVPSSSHSEYWEDNYGRDERGDRDVYRSGSPPPVPGSRPRSPVSYSVSHTAHGEI